VTQPDDLRLLRLLRARDREGCAEFVRAHYQAVYRFLAHLTRDVHQAEDLTQETFAAALEKISGFEGRASLATWLHRIAYTRFIDAHRAELRSEKTFERVRSSMSSAVDPLDTVSAGEEAQRLYRTLHALDTPERTVLVLHYLQGLSYREMSAVLEEPTGTLKWRTTAALDQLRNLLNHEAPGHATRR
jgi:RNA polymerase sigma-70 factor (ECF subfamily)